MVEMLGTPILGYGVEKFADYAMDLSTEIMERITGAEKMLIAVKTWRIYV